MKKKIFTYSALFFAMLFWGFSFVWTKIALDDFRPFTILIIRLVISACFLWGISLIFKKVKKIALRDFGWIFLLALFEPFLYFIGESYGLTMVSSTVAAVIVSTIPLVTPFAAFFLLKEKISVSNIIGIIISLLGVYFVVLKNEYSFAISLEGLFLLLLAVLSAVAYSMVIVKLSGKYNVFMIISWQNTIGVFYFLPLFFIFDYKYLTFQNLQWQSFIPLIKLAIFASSLSFMFYTYGVKNFGVSKANMYTNTVPVFTLIFAWILLDEIILFKNLIGIFLVLFGLLVAQFNLFGRLALGKKAQTDIVNN